MKISKSALTELFHQYYKTPAEHKDENVLIHGQAVVFNKLSKECILFLDEISRAQPDVKASALQLVLDKQIHQHKLPTVNGKKAFIVAAMNPDDGTYNTQELDPALHDRFLFIDAEADIQSWLAWAKKAAVNQVVREYLAENPDHLYNKPKEGRWATPRGWAMLGKHVDNFDKIDAELHFSLIAGKIGSSIGTRFEAFYRNFSRTVKIEDIIKVSNEAAKKSNDVLEIAEVLKEFLDEKQLDTIILTEKVNQMIDKLLPKSKDSIDTKKVMPMMAFLHALDLEVLAGVLHKYKAEEAEKYSIIAECESKMHSDGKKKLFLKLISGAKK